MNSFTGIAAAEGDDVVRGRGEDTGAGADLGHDQDRGEERDHRAEVAKHVLDLLRAQQARGEGGGRRGQSDRRLGATGRVSVRRHQQRGEGDHRHRVEEGSHGRNLRHL